MEWTPYASWPRAVMFNEVNMRKCFVLLSIAFKTLWVSAQYTLTQDFASWLVKTSLYDSESHLVREKRIFDESTESYFKLYTSLQDSGYVKLVPIDSVYADTNPSHQILEVELLEKSHQYILDTTSNQVENKVTIELYTYDSLEIIDIDNSNEYYEIKFRILNPNPTPFYLFWYKGEDARKESFESIRYARLNNGVWEIDRYPFKSR